MYLKNSTWPPWYDEIAMPCASSCSAQFTISSTDRLWPRWITSQPRRLQDAPHDVDRRVVAVEQARGRDEAHLVDRLVDERRSGGVVHRGTSAECERPGGKAYTAASRAVADALDSHGSLYYVYVNVNIGRLRRRGVDRARGRPVAFSRRVPHVRSNEQRHAEPDHVRSHTLAVCRAAARQALPEPSRLGRRHPDARGDAAHPLPATGCPGGEPVAADGRERGTSASSPTAR